MFSPEQLVSIPCYSQFVTSFFGKRFEIVSSTRSWTVLFVLFFKQPDADVLTFRLLGVILRSMIWNFLLLSRSRRVCWPGNNGVLTLLPL